jgi:hypothetical protein
LQSKRKRDLRIGALKLENRARYAQMVVREISRGFSTACELNQEPGAIAVPALNVHWPDKPSRAAGRGRNTAGTFDSSVAAASHTEVAANLANQNTFQERSLPAGKMPGYTISPTSTSRRRTSPWQANARDLALRVEGVSCQIRTRINWRRTPVVAYFLRKAAVFRSASHKIGTTRGELSLGVETPTVTFAPCIVWVDFDPHPARGYGGPLRHLFEIRARIERALSRLESQY